MKKTLVWIFTELLIILSFAIIINLFKEYKILNNNFKNELSNITEKYNLLEIEFEELENKVSGLEESFERSETSTTSRGSYNRNTTSNSSSWSDLELLARIINAEAGGCTDEHQLLVGNVVLNRVADPRYPNTIYEVIYQRGQYSPTWNGAINKIPTEQAYKNAQRLLDGERFCPSNVIFQANFKQGSGVYKEISTSYSTTYFCY